MGAWWLVLIFGGIGLFALALYAVLGLSLWRKAKVLMADLGRLSAVAATAEAAMSPDRRSPDDRSYTDEPVDHRARGVHRR